MKYKLVKEYGSELLGKAVNNLLEKGWQLYGDPFFSANNNYCQAVVNYTQTVGHVDILKGVLRPEKESVL